MAREFGRRRPPPGTETTYSAKGDSVLGSLSLPPVEPMQILYGIGFCLLGYLLGISLFVTLLPQPRPEFLRFVYVPGEARTGLIQDSFEVNHPKILMPGEK